MNSGSVDSLQTSEQSFSRGFGDGVVADVMVMVVVVDDSQQSPSSHPVSQVPTLRYKSCKTLQKKIKVLLQC